MSTWASLHKLFLQTVGDSQAARDEAWTHLSEGYREVATRVDPPELAAIDESVALTIDQDYVNVSSVDLSVYAILDGFNVTDGCQIYPEPGGMTGRNRYLTDTGKPSAGNVTHYMRDGSRIYLRGTPDKATTLRFRVKQQTPTLTLANANDSPLTPPQHDMAIVFAAAESFYMVHPKTEMDGQTPVMLSQKFREAKQVKLATVEALSPRVEEDRSRNETFRLRGYSLRGSRRRW